MIRSAGDSAPSRASRFQAIGIHAFFHVAAPFKFLRDRAHACVGAALAAAMLALPMPASAYLVETKLVPFAGNISPWGGAANPINIDRFLGPQWDASTGAINLSLKACADVPIVGEVCVGYGVDGKASTKGRLGFDLGLQASGGSVQVALPMTAALDVFPGVRGIAIPRISFEEGAFGLEGGGFNYLNSQGALLAMGPPTLRSFAPTFEAHLDAVAELGFSASGHICYFYCIGGNVGAQLGGAVNLFNVGPTPGGGYSASAIGVGQVNLPVDIPLSNIATLTINVPNVNTDSSKLGGYDPATRTVNSMARDTVFGLSLDIAAMVGKAFPILDPFVGNHDIGPIGSYNLLSASLGVFLEYVEKFTASVREVVVGFVFSDPVSVNNGPASPFAVLAPGQDLFIEPAPGVAGFKSVGAWPVFFVKAGIHHQPSLVPTVAGELKILDFSLAGKDFEPVASKKIEVALGQFNLPSFDTLTDFIPIVGRPFNIYPTVVPITTDRCRTEFCSENEFREERRECGDSSPRGCDPALRPHRVWLVNGSCPETTPAYQCPGAVLLGDTSLGAYTDQLRSDLVFTNASSFDFPEGSQGPNHAADYAMNWLAAHGVAANAPAFPPFPPFVFPFPIVAAVPEPGTIGLGFAGLIALAFLRRSRGRGKRGLQTIARD